MPRVIITEGAARDSERCRRFLVEKNPQAATRAGRAIEHQFALLETEPEIRRPLYRLPELRELIIPFGDSGYVALYRFDARGDSGMCPRLSASEGMIDNGAGQPTKSSWIRDDATNR